MLLGDISSPEYEDITTVAPITIHHQFWHRDGMQNMVAVTNTTNAVRITYVP